MPGTDVPRHTGNSVNGAALAGSWLYVSGGDEGLITAAFISTPSEVFLPLALH